MKAEYILLILLITAGVLTGCSAADSSGLTPIDMPDAARDNSYKDSQRVLWGMWDITFDLEGLTAEVVPARVGDAHYNIVSKLQPPACNDCIGIAVVSFDPVTRILDANVTIKNPTYATGFDVRGIVFMTDAGHELVNPDAWTKLHDIPSGADMNPFRAYGKETSSRAFSGLAQHTEKFLLYIPQPPQYFAIKYAVDASFPGNCKEPYDIEVFELGDMYDFTGSQAALKVYVRDWQDDANKLTLVLPEITGEQFTQLEYDADDVWELTLENKTGAAAGFYEGRFIATSTGSGDLALYDWIVVEVKELPPGWARTWGSILDFDEGVDVAIDSSGNAYVTGNFNGMVDFDPGPGTDVHTSKGETDVFLCKYDTMGVFQWVRCWGGNSADAGLDVALSGAGDVYACGMFMGTVDFDPGTGMDNHAAVGNIDSFLCKYDQDGNFQWAKHWGGTSSEVAIGLGVDSSNDAYIGGYFMGAVDFDPGAGTANRTSAGVFDIYLCKFDSTGAFQWVQAMGDTGMDVGADVAVDHLDYVYIAGKFSGGFDFNPDGGVDTHTSKGGTDIFVSRFNSSGGYAWTNTWGDTGNDEGLSVSYAAPGVIYVGGVYEGTVDFDYGGGVDSHTSLGKLDAFISRITAGGAFEWAKTWGGVEDVLPLSVTADADGSVYVAGVYEGSANFNPGGTDNHTSLGGEDVFMMRLFPDGEFAWACGWGGAGTDGGNGIAALDGFLFITGWYRGTVDFDPFDGVDDHTAVGERDSFLSRFTYAGGWW